MTSTQTKKEKLESSTTTEPLEHQLEDRYNRACRLAAKTLQEADPTNPEFVAQFPEFVTECRCRPCIDTVYGINHFQAEGDCVACAARQWSTPQTVDKALVETITDSEVAEKHRVNALEVFPVQSRHETDVGVELVRCLEGVVVSSEITSRLFVKYVSKCVTYADSEITLDTAETLLPRLVDIMESGDNSLRHEAAECIRLLGRTRPSLLHKAESKLIQHLERELASSCADSSFQGYSAACALGALAAHDDRVSDDLLEALTIDASPSTLQSAWMFLLDECCDVGESPDVIVNALQYLLNTPDPQARWTAIQGLYTIVTKEIDPTTNGPNPVVPTTILEVLADPSVEFTPPVRLYMVRTLTECVAYTSLYLRVGPEPGKVFLFEVDQETASSPPDWIDRVVSPFVAWMATDNPQTRLAAAEGLARTATIVPIGPDLVEELATYTHTTRIAAVLALIAIAGEESEPDSLPRILPDHEKTVRTTALDLVGAIAEAYPDAVDPATPQLLDLRAQDVFQEASQQVHQVIDSTPQFDSDTRPNLSEPDTNPLSREPHNLGR